MCMIYHATLRCMAVGFEEISFESTQTMTQAQFARWVRSHDGWDPNRYELLSGRIVMNPPAGSREIPRRRSRSRRRGLVAVDCITRPRRETRGVRASGR